MEIFRDFPLSYPSASDLNVVERRKLDCDGAEGETWGELAEPLEFGLENRSVSNLKKFPC